MQQTERMGQIKYVRLCQSQPGLPTKSRSKGKGPKQLQGQRAKAAARAKGQSSCKGKGPKQLLLTLATEFSLRTCWQISASHLSAKNNGLKLRSSRISASTAVYTHNPHPTPPRPASARACDRNGYAGSAAGRQGAPPPQARQADLEQVPEAIPPGGLPEVECEGQLLRHRPPRSRAVRQLRMQAIVQL